MHLLDKLKQFINGPHGMNMGARDAHLKPEYARIPGTRVVDDNHIHEWEPVEVKGKNDKVKVWEVTGVNCDTA